MIAEFSFIVARGGYVLKNRQETMKFLYELLKMIDAIEVSEEAFDKSYKTIPRVVVQHSDKVRELEYNIARGERDIRTVKMKDIESGFKKIDTGQTAIFENKMMADPRYGILDIHLFDDCSVMNIAINTMTDFKVKTYLNIGIARRLNIAKYHDVISVVTDRATGKQIEFYESNHSSNRTYARSIVGADETSSALVGYSKISGLDVSTLLKKIDENININDAPEVLQEIDNTIDKIMKSIKFMEEGGYDKPSIDAAKREIAEIIPVREMYAKLIGKKSNMMSIYFRINKPDKIKSLIGPIAATGLLDIESIKNISDM